MCGNKWGVIQSLYLLSGTSILRVEAWEALPETWPQEGASGAQEDEERPKTRVLVSTLQNSTRWLLLVCWMMRAGFGVVGEVAEPTTMS